MARQRTDTRCGICGAYRHRTCPECGQTNLLNRAAGLVDHASRDLHRCASRSHEATSETETTASEPITGRNDADEPTSEPTSNAGSGKSDNLESGDPLADALFKALKPRLGNLLDTEALERNIREIAQREARNVAPIKVEVVRPSGETIEVAGAHESFATLMRLVGARMNAFIVGPAGSGKTRGGEMAADAAGLGFYPKSMGPATTEYALMGHMDATGTFRPGIAWKPFTEGGVLMLDEIDSANPAALTTMNTMLANEYCSFPHMVARKHPDFVLIASGNTYGRGANREYVGRQQLDAATLNRFNVIDWGYDARLETDIAAAMAAQCNERTAREITQWAAYVQGVRASAEAQGIRMVAGTRDIIDGARGLIAGFTLTEVKNMRFWTSLDRDTRIKVESGVKA